MALGDTLKLGYLECAVWGNGSSRPHSRSKDFMKGVGNGSSRPHSRSKSESKSVPSSRPHSRSRAELEGISALVLDKADDFGGTLKINDVEAGKASHCEEPSKAEAPIQPLEWTHPPHREVKKEGNVRYQVSKSAAPSKRDHKHHLVRTTRIEPQHKSGAVSGSSSRHHSSPNLKAKEEIIVSEADFRRCGHRLTLLRGCKLEKLPEQPKEEPKIEMELSFKSAFVNRCRSQETPWHDEWVDHQNPEQIRPHYEGDLVLNQIWMNESTPQKADNIVDDDEALTPLVSDRSHTSSCTDPMDACVSWSQRSQGRAKTQPDMHCESRKGSRRAERRRAYSQGHISADNIRTLLPRDVSTPPRQSGGYDSSRRRSSHTSGCPKPHGRDSSVKKPKEYVSRIQLIEDNSSDEDAPNCVGSLAVQTGTRMQRRFEQKLAEDSEYNMKEQALWLSLDPLTGEVSSFSRAAAERLESGYVNNRSRVPLVGLEKEVEDDIVHLGMNGSSEHPVQKSLSGGQKDVRRLMVRVTAPEVIINVIWDHCWRIADTAIPGTTEERKVVLNGTETVRPPTPPLPPLNPDRRAAYSCMRPWWDDIPC